MSTDYVRRPTQLPLAAREQEAAERWADIPSAPGYQASTLGRIRSVDRIVERLGATPQRCRGQILAPISGRNRRLTVKTGGGVRRKVHRLVLEAFVGPCPDGMECCHGNGNAADNRLSNIRWDTHKANIQDQIRHGSRGARRPKPGPPRCWRGHLKVAPNLVGNPRPRAVHPQCAACSWASKELARMRRDGLPPSDLSAIAEARYLQILEEALLCTD